MSSCNFPYANMVQLSGFETFFFSLFLSPIWFSPFIFHTSQLIQFSLISVRFNNIGRKAKISAFCFDKNYS